MNIKEFSLQNEDGSLSNFKIVTILKLDKYNSLYLVYYSEDNQNELLIAKLNIDSEKIYLENIDNIDEINAVNELLLERGIK